MAQDRGKRVRRVSARFRLPGGPMYAYDHMPKLVQSMFDGHCSVKTCGHEHSAPFFVWGASSVGGGEAAVPACRVCRFEWAPDPEDDPAAAFEVARFHVELQHPEVYARFMSEAK